MRQAKGKDVVDGRDAFVFGGLLLMGAGVWQIYRPAAYIVVGFGIFGIGMGFLSRAK